MKRDIFYKSTRDAIRPKRGARFSLLGLFFILSIVMALAPTRLSAQSCSYNLKVANNIESVNDEGRVYFMSLQNNGNNAVELNFNAVNTYSGKNPDESDATGNVTLNIQLLSSNGSPLAGQLHLEPGSVIDFLVKVTVPQGTAPGKWNNVMVSATSSACPDYVSALTLFTYIPDPQQE